MKKFLSFLLTFAMLFTLAMPAMAAEGDSLSTIYIDVGQLEEAASVQSVYLYTKPDSLVANESMTHVGGTIYSYDISAGVAGGETYALFSTFSGDGETHLGTYFTAKFETGKNLWIATGHDSGTWSTYGAAEGGNTGGTDKDVTANFDPGEIKFTGISFSSEFEHRYDADSNTYTVIIPADKIGGGVSYDVNLIGENLSLIDESNTLLMIAHDDTETGVAPNEILVQTLRDHGCYNFGMSARDGFQRTDFYSNDGGITWISVSSEVKQAYYLTVTDSEHGTVTASAYALQGDTVSLTVTPDAGYELDTLTVMNGETAVEVTNNTFTMPAGAVTVTASFKEATPHKINIGASENGSVTADYNEATVGTTVTLTVAPDEDCRLVELIVNDGAVEVTKLNDTTYTFVMPDADVTVNATFEKIPHSVNVETSENGTVSADKQTAVAGETVTLTWEAAEGYTLDKITVTDASGEEVTVDQGVLACTFVMPSSDVTVTATFKVQLVTSVAITWGSMEFTYDDTVAEGATEENGWTCEADSNNIVVENTGETTFTAQAAYASYEGYESITGSFDPASKELAIGEKYTFTLELSGKPTKVLSGDKIGKVTITINEAAEG